MDEPQHEISRENLSLEEKFLRAYEPANASRNVVNYLRDHPFCQNQELAVATNLRGWGDHKEIQYLAAGILDTRQKIRSAYTQLQAWAIANGKKISETLFLTAVNKPGIRPVGMLEMSALDNPFAMVITTGQTDFLKLGSPDLAGYFRQHLELKFNGNTADVPFIAMSRDTSLTTDEIILHEQSHGHIQAVRDSLESGGKSNLWGEPLISEVPDRVKIISRLLTAFKDLPVNTNRLTTLSQNPDFKAIIGHVDSQIKDELIAHLISGHPIADVFIKGGVYDRLRDEFALNSISSELYDLFWESLIKNEGQQALSMEKALKTYQRSGVTNRVDILPWMLMRIPLDRWKAELNETGLASEVELLDKINDPQSVKSLTSKPDRLYVSDLATLWQKLTSRK